MITKNHHLDAGSSASTNQHISGDCDRIVPVETARVWHGVL